MTNAARRIRCWNFTAFHPPLVIIAFDFQLVLITIQCRSELIKAQVHVYGGGLFIRTSVTLQQWACFESFD
ncbi:MAG: hypothetical protein LH647_04005 [Leptolyngbyaceae cyanobacterium CAN_BIN12]|nr:hypothetical protein [Leptolyngbyaceae cyanobacterium CAN_BIN12]